ncbi:hypothetical protein [Desulforamulus hydrothermalis]|uniref:Uncharacterized protein n=1 Tax=Desulforamulus hydrothermalis Lam5 = DSM 18033 TaxID=1121428 RepID=K8EGZ8_9FIRM|nr:hypothetical protein [Desulforamulus hydrothermalis]CCO07891.1 exported hypothetical protein [Desulforamulus hydrothermalis Lam5 = DSM 18033]SHH35225.1 hypothetical protein SAMN02745177_02279 [Desulforamulus hydrothermalis Lam5 = DSM 18033]
MPKLRYMLALAVFLSVVAGGIVTAHRCFNDVVLPARPVSLYSLERPSPGVLQIQVMGEKLTADLPAARERAVRAWQQIKDMPLINEKAAVIKQVITEQWPAGGL